MKQPLAEVMVPVIWALIMIAAIFLILAAKAEDTPPVAAPLPVSPAASVILQRISIQPLRLFAGPPPRLRCPAGYELWWPAGAEFEHDRYAECAKFPAARPMGKTFTKLARKN